MANWQRCGGLAWVSCIGGAHGSNVVDVGDQGGRAHGLVMVDVVDRGGGSVGHFCGGSFLVGLNQWLVFLVKWLHFVFGGCGFCRLLVVVWVVRLARLWYKCEYEFFFFFFFLVLR